MLRFCFEFQAILSLHILPIELLCGSRKKYIAAAVEGDFDGVLDDADDESDSQGKDRNRYRRAVHVNRYVDKQLPRQR